MERKREKVRNVFTILPIFLGLFDFIYIHSGGVIVDSKARLLFHVIYSNCEQRAVILPHTKDLAFSFNGDRYHYLFSFLMNYKNFSFV